MKENILMFAAVGTVAVALLRDSISVRGISNPAVVNTGLSQMGDSESRVKRLFSNENISRPLCQYAPEVPNFSGRWRLNRRASDDSGKVVRKVYARNREAKKTQGFVVQLVFWKRHNDLHKQLTGLLAQLEMPETLLIMHQDAVLTISDITGKRRNLYTDETQNPNFVGDIIAVTRWCGTHLVTEAHLQNQGAARWTFELAPGGFQLELTLVLKYPRVSKPVTIHCVYDFVAET